MAVSVSFISPALCSVVHCRCPWLTRAVSPAIPVYNGILFLFVLANFSMATFMDPGVFPRADEDEDKEDDFRAPLYKNVDVRGIQVRMKWCATCHFYRPPRCSHCSVCDNCVEVTAPALPLLSPVPRPYCLPRVLTTLPLPGL